ncbi:putative glycoprotein [Apple rootstock virus A]|uniref:Putative glycoprotein n=1 Tax=Apple rootstock virus A TaxID=2563012 RepID=A0A4D6DD31_9RHAB|nr:putative glycoprotein [Apple rootstock virus A]QBZ28537.1 putative glycoprotein [Apple rootstock virus A]
MIFKIIRKMNTILAFAVFALYMAVIFKIGNTEFNAEIRQNSPNVNPAKNPHSIKSEGKLYDAHDIYQPKYVCESADPTKAVSHPSWHHSCIASCKDEYEKDLVNITLMDWIPEGPDVDVYRIAMSEVCYTSHENVWGYCSQAQTVDPKTPTREEAVKIVRDITDGWKTVSLGTRIIKNSKEAECDYMSDLRDCANDYTVVHKTGKIYQKSDQSALEITIAEDGIRTEAKKEFLQLNDAVWVWRMRDKEASICGWKESVTISCHHKNESFLLECPDIGHSFSLESAMKHSTCMGDIFGVDNILPFKFAGTEKKDSRKDFADKMEADTTKDRTAVAIVKGMNQALSSLEITYCNSFCDVFTNLYLTRDNDVVQTPLGPWIMSKLDNNEVMYPCMVSADWVIADPITTCGTTNFVTVLNKATKEMCVWDMSKEYITSGATCSDFGIPDLIKTEEALPSKISDRKNVNITLYDGSTLMFSPPDYKPILVPSNSPPKIIPEGWMTKMKLDPSMIHDRADVLSMLTRHVNDTILEYGIPRTRKSSTYIRMVDEVTGGASHVMRSIWDWISQFFTGLKNLIFLMGLMIVIFIILKIRRIYTNAISHFTVSGTIPIEPGVVGQPILKKRRSRSRSVKHARPSENINMHNAESWVLKH